MKTRYFHNNKKYKGIMASKVNIMHLVYSLIRGGLEAGIVGRVNRLNSTYFNPSICCFIEGGPLTKLVRDGIDVVELKKKEGNDFTLPFKLMNLFKKKHIHIVYTHNWGTLCEGVIGAKLASVPIVIHQEHGTVIDVIKSKKIRFWAQQFIFNFVDQITTVSESLRRLMIESLGIDKKKIITILNGVDIDRFKNKINRNKEREKLGLRTDEPVIGTVGRLVPVKGHKTLLYSMLNLKKQIQGIKLLLIGDGPLRNELEELIKKLGLSENVLMLGEREDIPQLLKTMDVFVLPSLFEALSRTILEALASEVPVVTTSVGGNSEVIIHGSNGLLVPPQNPEKLAQAIITLLSDKDKSNAFRVAGRKLVEEKFSIQRMVEDDEKLFKYHLKRVGIWDA
ncbi:MAG: GT4 family glycosyltransferase PelF [bacterium]